MANPDTYSAASGKAIYAGRVAPAEWVPPPGYFADIPMLNMAEDANPPPYGATNYMTQPFDQWGGSVVLRDHGQLGAQLYYAGGHENSAAQIHFQASLLLDFDALLWKTKNYPVAPNTKNTVNIPTGMFPDGSFYVPHTYLGLQEFPAAWGGGPKGSVVRFLSAGSEYYQNIHVIDPSQTNYGVAPMAISGPGASADGTGQLLFKNTQQIVGNYPFSDVDHNRQGWWLGSNSSNDFTLFISKTGVVTQHPTMSASPAWPCMIYADSLDLLILVNGGNSEAAARSMTIRDLATGVTRSVNMIGNPPCRNSGSGQYRPEIAGFQWVEELGCIVGIDCMELPMKMTTITPPATNPESNPWTCAVVPMQHWTAGDPGGSSVIRYAENGNFTKFRWVPSLQAFVLGTGRNVRPQVFKL